MRFLLTPRWLGLLLVVVLLGLACVRLSQWQFDRYQQRKDANASVRANLAAEPVPLRALMTTTTEPSSQLEWRTVTATGSYDPSHQVAVLYRTRAGSPGVDVVTPFVPDEGPAVLVDRGWVPAPANGNLAQTLPAPARGRVTINGWVRADSDAGADQVSPSQGSVRAISARALSESLPYPLLDGFLQLTDERPTSPQPPSKAGAPDLSGGPSFFYGFQWLFFALLFFGFYCYFAWAEYQDQAGRTRVRSARRRTAPEPQADADTDDLVTSRE